MRLSQAPINSIITSTKDLEYVNQRLSAFSFSGARVLTVNSGRPSLVSPKISYASPQNSNIFDSGIPMASSALGSDTPGPSKVTSTASATSLEPSTSEPVPIQLISPNSNIHCGSRDCPIKGILHNIGKYFHNGEQASQNPGLVELGVSAKPISHYFNFTVPPPEIVAAYVKMCKDEATPADKEEVRQYQKHHMWSPINSEPSTPRYSDGSETLRALPLPMRDPISWNKYARTPYPADWEDSLAVARLNESIEGIWIEAGRNHDAIVGSYEDDSNDPLGGPVVTRDFPQGTELKRVQLRLQENILDKIAQLIHGDDGSSVDWDDCVAGWGEHNE